MTLLRGFVRIAQAGDDRSLHGRATGFMKATLLVAFIAVVQLAAAVAGETGYKDILIHAPRAELPLRAANLIAKAKVNEREAATVEVVKTCLQISPTSGAIIVSAIAQAAPDMASIAAGVAAAEQPKQAAAIARAAAAAVPTRTGSIVIAVCRAVPNEYRNIAVAVAQAVPASGIEILNAVGIALPDVKTAIDRVLSGYSGNNLSVAKVLDPVDQSQSSGRAGSSDIGTAPSIKAPIFGPPYIPLSGTPTNVQPTASGNVPPGGRGGPMDYAQP